MGCLMSGLTRRDHRQTLGRLEHKSFDHSNGSNVRHESSRNSDQESNDRQSSLDSPSDPSLATELCNMDEHQSRNYSCDQADSYRRNAGFIGPSARKKTKRTGAGLSIQSGNQKTPADLILARLSSSSHRETFRLSPSNKVHQAKIQDPNIMSQEHPSESRDKRKYSDPTDVRVTNSRLSKHEDWNSEVGVNSSVDRRHNQRSACEAKLFTSSEQLCSEVISKIMDNHDVPCQENQDQKSIGKLLCLFIFGSQGSSEGEVIFELIDHSSILKALSGETNQRALYCESSRKCPLYHYMDVGALIEANIDSRIREYKQIRQQTMNVRRKQMGLGVNSFSVDADLEGSTASKVDKATDEDDDKENSELEKHGDSSDREQSDSSSLESAEESSRGEFDFSSLNTRHRSRLQLKLLRHFNSVTYHWVLNLIETAIDRLEASLLDCKTNYVKSDPRELDRVYLVKLVPTQLSIFKTCLYLHQSSSFKDFKYPFHAIKFEPRTNIRLFRRESPNRNKSQSGFSKTGKSKLYFGLMNLKAPKFILLGLPIEQAMKQLTGDQNQARDKRVKGNRKRPIESDLLIPKDEKLAPKFIDGFVRHFESMSKLTFVRYNPTEDIYQSLPTLQRVEIDHKVEIFKSFSDSEGPNSERNDKLALNLAKQANDNSGRSQSLSPSSAWLDDLGENYANSMVSSTSTNQTRSSVSMSINKDSRTTRSPLTLMTNDQTKNLRPRSTVNLRTGNQTQLPALKWAVEVEIVDEKQSSRLMSLVHCESNSRKPQAGHQQSRKARRRSTIQELESQAITIYQAPKSPSNNFDSDSPMTRDFLFMRPRAGSSLKAKIQYPSQSAPYLLVPVRVAYANGQSQLLFELRCGSIKSLKLKSSSDLDKLVSAFEEARTQLEFDCDRWIYDALGLRHSSHPSTGKRQSMSSSAQVTSKGHKSSAKQSNHSLVVPLPTLVVFTIQLDVGRLLSGHFVYPADFGDPGLDQLTGAHSSCLRRPSIKLKRQSSKNRETDEQISKPTRHVQFRLTDLARCEAGGSKGREDLRLQHRHWVSESLFVSYSSDSSPSLSPTEQRLIELVGDLLRYQIGLH